MGEISEILGKRVNELREARGMNQDDYADFLGISLKTLWNIEKSRRSIRFDILEKIIKTENILPHYLFMHDEDAVKQKKYELDNAIYELINNLNDKDLQLIKALLELIAKKKS